MKPQTHKDFYTIFGEIFALFIKSVSRNYQKLQQYLYGGSIFQVYLVQLFFRYKKMLLYGREMIIECHSCYRAETCPTNFYTQHFISFAREIIHMREL